MSVRHADPDEAEALGVLDKGTPEPQQHDLNENVEINVPEDMDSDTLDAMMQSLGNLAYIVADKIKLRSSTPPREKNGGTA